MDYNKIEDAIFKKAMEAFKESAVKFFRIDSKIIAPAQTEIKNVDIKTNYMDYLFYLENGEYLHFEFQSTNKRDDIKRFLYYDASLFFRDRRKIRTIVIYSSEIEKADEFLDAGTIKYSIEPFYMNKIDADEKLSYLEGKIKNGENLNKEDILTLTFLPLMHAKESKSDRIIKSVKLMEKINSRELRNESISLLYALFDKFGDEEDKNKFKEMIAMTEIGKMIHEDGVEEGRKEGIKEGKIEGKKEGKAEGKSEIVIKLLTKKFKKLPEDYINKIKLLSDITLETIATDIFDMKEVQDLEKYF